MTDGEKWMDGALSYLTEKRTKKAVVLLSGGIDSCVTMNLAVQAGWELCALSFNYGQVHAIEVRFARAIAKAKGIPLEESSISMLTGSALTDKSQDIPLNRNPTMMTDIPSTYVPSRNAILLSMAASFAEAHDISDIFFGANILDYSGYPDCRPEFLGSFEDTINLGSAMVTQDPEKRIRIRAPLLYLSKAEIIKKGADLGLDLGKTTVSCYRASLHGKACGQCDSCVLRMKGFKDAGVWDTTPYMTGAV